MENRKTSAQVTAKNVGYVFVRPSVVNVGSMTMDWLGLGHAVKSVNAVNFKAYFMCLYGISLWWRWNFNISTMLNLNTVTISVSRDSSATKSMIVLLRFLWN